MRWPKRGRSREQELEAARTHNEAVLRSTPAGRAEAEQARDTFLTHFPLDHDNGFYGAGIVTRDSAWAIYVIGKRKALVNLPNEFEGRRVVKSVRRRAARLLSA